MMTHSQFLYCPCWDPWKIGCKRLLRTKADQLHQKPKSTVISTHQKQIQFAQKRSADTSRSAWRRILARGLTNLIDPACKRRRGYPTEMECPLPPPPSTPVPRTNVIPKSFAQSLKTRERLNLPVNPAAAPVDIDGDIDIFLRLVLARTIDIDGDDGTKVVSKITPQITPEVEKISSGFTLIRTTDQIEATLQDSIFEKKKPIKPIVPSSPPKLETEDVIADLVEQISELTAIMEQLRRDHHTTHKQLEKEMAEKCTELQEEHEKRIKEMMTYHASEMDTLEDQYKKELRSERATAQEKLAGLQKEYKYLKNAFRVYQDSISDEMEEKWLRRQAEWKKSERTEREKALLQQKQSLTRKFELELEEQKKIIQNDSFLVDRIFQKEREEHQMQHREDSEKIAELEKKIEGLEAQLNEKDETLDAIASTLYKTEMELKNEKTNIAEMEKAIQQRIAAVEEKHRINVTALIDENVSLRRKLIEKNEEIYNERARKSGIGSFDWNQL